MALRDDKFGGVEMHPYSGVTMGPQLRGAQSVWGSILVGEIKNVVIVDGEMMKIR